jgi:DNA-binding transcriptional LysR family regulator
MSFMDLRTLECFLMLTEELHFGRAARRAGITQPALSHQIRRLEEELDVVLFERTSRRVALTDAGTALITGARRVLTDAERARRHCHEAAAGGAGQLALASIGAALNSIVPGLVRTLRRERPGIAVHLTQMDTPVALGALRDGRVDVAIVRSAPEVPGIEVRDLLAEPMVAALADSHPLADRERVDVIDLRDDDFVLWPRSVSESFHDQVIGVCQRAGFSPRVVMEGTDIETQLGLVSAGIGVLLMPAGFMALRRVGVAFARLAPPVPTSMLQLAWLDREPSAAARGFIDLACRAGFREHEWFLT